MASPRKSMEARRGETALAGSTAKPRQRGPRQRMRPHKSRSESDAAG